MSREDIHKLLGGYATGTLTAEERQALFAAALEDQELFDELAKEQPLHDLLRDSGARAQLIGALEDQPARWYNVWLRPALATAALAGIALMAVLVFRGKPPAPQRMEVAQVKPVEPAPLAEQPKLKDFHAPPPAPVRRQKAQIAAPPEVVSPKLETHPLALPATAPAPPSVATAEKSEVADAVPGVAGAIGGVKPVEPLARMSANSAVFRTAAPLEANRFGIRYTILHKQANGELTPADPKELVKGDSVELRFETELTANISVATVNDAGVLHVVAAGFVARNSPFTTPVLPQGAAMFHVSFSRPNVQATSGFIDKAASVSAADTRDRITYVAAPADWQSLTIPIRLTYR